MAKDCLVYDVHVLCRIDIEDVSLISMSVVRDIFIWRCFIVYTRCIASSIVLYSILLFEVRIEMAILSPRNSPFI